MTARRVLADQLRQFVLDQVADGTVTVTAIAEALDVSKKSIESLLAKPRWDIDLSLALIGRLGLAFQVVPA